LEEKLMNFTKAVVTLILPLALSHYALADTFGSGAFSIDFVNIGNPGNAPDTTGNPPPPYPTGAVAYGYRISKFEVSERMITAANSLGNLQIGQENRGPTYPATMITWNEAARFVNWLNTSTGSVPAYKFAIQPGQGGYSSNSDIQLWTLTDAGYNPNNLYRNSLAHYFLPSVDEWYKAAYYDPTSGVYYDYPTGSNSPPTPVGSGTAPGTAVYHPAGFGAVPVTQAGGLSPFGTMGQGGNVWEWNETSYTGVNDSSSLYRFHRGGTWESDAQWLAATGYNLAHANEQGFDIGFRVASVPEPSSSLLAVSFFALLASRRHRGEYLSWLEQRNQE
jgi:hypothetical protein